MFVNGRTFESVKQTEAVAHITIAFGRVSTFAFALHRCVLILRLVIDVCTVSVWHAFLKRDHNYVIS